MSTDSTRPLVSLGMPVFNGERYLRSALDSLVAQDYSNIELIICDNASTDGTRAIALEYAARDARVRYTRNGSNIGANKNFNRVFMLARGELFAWVAYDDLWDPRYVSRCVEALASNPSAVLAFSRIGLIDLEGRPWGEPRRNPLIGASNRRSRFHAAMTDGWWGLSVYAVIRTEILRRTGLHREVMGGDKVLIVELSLHGDFVEVPEVLWFYRERPFDAQYRSRLPHVFQLEGAWHARFPYASLAREYLRVLRRSNIPAAERTLLAADVVRWYFGDHWLRRVLIGAGEQLIGMEAMEKVRGSLARWRKRRSAA